MGRSAIPFEEQVNLRTTYRDQPLTQRYAADLVCFGKILVEIKSVQQLIPKHESQVLKYLYATELELGTLVNVGTHSKLESKRLALSKAAGSE